MYLNVSHIYGILRGRPAIKPNSKFTYYDQICSCICGHTDTYLRRYKDMGYVFDVAPRMPTPTHINLLLIHFEQFN